MSALMPDNDLHTASPACPFAVDEWARGCLMANVLFSTTQVCLFVRHMSERAYVFERTVTLYDHDIRDHACERESHGSTP